MNGISYKYKIYIIAGAAVVLALIFFFFIYGSMTVSNRTLAESVGTTRQEYEDVLAEQKSYELGKKDLADLSSKSLQPADLFSEDTKVVKEIKTMEAVSRSFGLIFTLQVTGTAKDAQKVPTSISKVSTVPYTMVLEGPFDKIVNFMETTQHLPFITHINSVTMSGSPTGTVRATLAAVFYIKP